MATVNAVPRNQRQSSEIALARRLDARLAEVQRRRAVFRHGADHPLRPSDMPWREIKAPHAASRGDMRIAIVFRARPDHG